MALQKDLDTPQGVTASYWIIDRFTVNKTQKKCSVNIAGYKDQPTRDANPNAGSVADKSVIISGSEFDTIYTNVVDNDADLYTEMYDFITNNHDFFTDATDV